MELIEEFFSLRTSSLRCGLSAKAGAAPRSLLLPRKLSLCLAGPGILAWRNRGNAMLQMVNVLHPPKSPECAGISVSFLLSSGCSSHQRVSSWLFQLHLLPMSSCVHNLQWQTLPHVRWPGVWLPHRLPGLSAQSESAFSNRCQVSYTFQCLCGSEWGSECFPGTLLSWTGLWMIEELSNGVCGHASKRGAML